MHSSPNNPTSPIFSTHEECVSKLKSSQLVVLPTETVYGLAASALDEFAVSKIFKLKGRPSTNPLIVHVADLEMGSTVACINDNAVKIAKSFWPGPVTVVLPKKDIIPQLVSAGLSTVGIRQPAQKDFLAIIKSANLPIAAPSANKSNQLSPTSPDQVIDGLGKECPSVLDGGLCEHGIESTVIDLSQKNPVILRPGPVSKAEIEKCLNIEVKECAEINSIDSVARRSPGLSRKHYSPNTPLLVKNCFNDLTQIIYNKESDLVICHDEKELEYFKKIDIKALSLSDDGDCSTIARNLYKTFHTADKMKKKRLITHFLENAQGLAKSINDRLNRASIE